MNEQTDQTLRRQAERRVKKKMGFLIHAGIFVLVNLGLAAINRVGGGPHGHLWPLAGWGIGPAMHGILTVVSLRGEGVRERMLEREIERLKRDR